MQSGKEDPLFISARDNSRTSSFRHSAKQLEDGGVGRSVCSQARKKETGRESEAVVASSHYRLLLLLEAVFGSCLKPIQATAAGLRPSPRGLTKVKLS